MVTLTDHAVAAIENLTTQSEAPPRSGLRIAMDGNRGSLQLSLAPQPVQGDEVVESGGARLFLDRDAAVALDTKALDAGTDPDGRVMFTVVEPSS
ncbi:MAG: adhesin [Micromonosporaceae bacterium]|nr:adhesin [Micromonosporaceae bacterium]